MAICPITKKLILLAVLIIICFLPVTSIKIKLPLLIGLFIIYGKYLIFLIYLIFSAIGIYITKQPSLYRGLCHSLVYGILDCDNRIPTPNYPVIFISNYPVSHLDFLVPGVFPKETCVITSKEVGSKIIPWVYSKNNYILVKREKNHGNGGFEKLLQDIQTSISKGIQIFFMYVDDIKTRNPKDDTKITKLHQGAFAISKQLKIPLVPVAVDRIRVDNFVRITNKKFNITLDYPFISDNIQSDMNKVCVFFTSNLK